jgi:hypothetical protein
MMTATGVHEVVSRLKAAGVPFWLDGGWGIDALVGRETRPTTISTSSSHATPSATHVSHSPHWASSTRRRRRRGFRRASSSVIRVDARSTST